MLQNGLGGGQTQCAAKQLNVILNNVQAGNIQVIKCILS
jgi:hypothetical protein